MADFDLQFLHAVYGGKHGVFGPLMVALTLLFGGWASVALFPLAMWRRTRRLAFWLAFAVALQAALVVLMKRVFGRVRPWLALGLPAPPTEPHDGSFPSGHAAGNFCVAAFVIVVLPILWPRSVWRARLVSPLTMVLAASVSFSRVYLGAHFLSDVVAGAALGALIGAYAGRRYASGPPGARGASTR